MQNYCSRNMHTGRTRSVQPRQSQRLVGGSQVGGAPLARLLEQLTDIECPGRAPAREAPPPPMGWLYSKTAGKIRKVKKWYVPTSTHQSKQKGPLYK